MKDYSEFTAKLPTLVPKLTTALNDKQYMKAAGIATGMVSDLVGLTVFCFEQMAKGK